MAMTRRGVGGAGLALVGVLLVGLGLRFAGLGYGLPAVYNQDEIAIMNRAMAFGKGDLNPHNFLYPTLYFYALFAWEGLFFIAGRAVGLFSSLAAFQRAFFVDPSPIYLAGRALTALCGAATIWATARLGARLITPAAGLIAALLVAVSPLAVRDAHYVKHDVPVTLLIVLTHVVVAGLVVDVARRQRAWGWMLAGAAAGLAMSTHYYAIFVALPVAAAALLPDNGTWSGRTSTARLATAGVSCVVAFFLASPFLLIEPGTALRDVIANRQIVMDRATAASGAFASLGQYGSMLGSDALGRLGILATAIGLVGAFRVSGPRALLLFAFPVPFLLFIANTVPASRYLNPLVPFLAVLAAAGLVWIARAGRAGLAAALVVGAAATAVAAASSIHEDRFFRQTDTRTLAAQYIEGHWPSGTSVLIQPYSVQLRPSRAALVEALRAHLGSEDRASVKFQLQLALDPYPEPSYRTIYLGVGGMDEDKIYVAPSTFDGSAGLAPLRALSVDYVVLKRYNEPDPSLAPLDGALNREGRLVATFSPYRDEVGPDERARVAPFLHNTDARIDAALLRPGPTIEIWRINQ
jgi:Dolichyl-phosphate-mannose-protein mannosyltransferase